MTRVLLPGAAVVLAIGLVLVLTGGEEVVDDNDVTAPVTESAPGRTAPAPAPAPGRERPERADPEGVDQAVARYIEAAETGTVDAPPGLPTSDELTIRSRRVVGRRATVRLAGGVVLYLRARGESWRVIRARSGGIPPPTPPSNG